jgi:hypothetical protein
MIYVRKDMGNMHDHVVRMCDIHVRQ